MRISDWSSDVCSSDLQSLDDLLWLQLGLRFSQILQQNFALALKVEIDQHLLDGFRTDAGSEGVFAIFVLRLDQFILSQKMIFFARRQAWFDDDVGVELKDTLKLL